MYYQKCVIQYANIKMPLQNGSCRCTITVYDVRLFCEIKSSLILWKKYSLNNLWNSDGIRSFKCDRL